MSPQVKAALIIAGAIIVGISLWKGESRGSTSGITASSRVMRLATT